MGRGACSGPIGERGGSGRRSGPRVLGFPFAGGGTAALRGLARRLRGEIELVPVLLPGRERRLDEAPLRSMDALVDRLERELAAELEEPFAFLGHSLGGLLAFELARRLEARGRGGPVHLFVAACHAPHALSVDRPIHALPDEAFLTAVEQLGGIPPELREHDELVRLVLPALRADFEVYETYRCEPGASVACPITALGGEADGAVPRADLLAWREVTRGPFASRWFPGGHFFVEAEAEGVARVLRATVGAPAGSGA